MKKRFLLACMFLIIMTASCGDDSQSDANIDRDTVQSGSVSQTSSGGDEQICRANLEVIAMFLLNERDMSGSLAETLEELQSYHPAYAELEVTCGGIPFIYEHDGTDFTLTCPNGHGEFHNDQMSW
ncbi:hypothetical protein DRQ25_14100 [Candidatus Fermentibacteria bacterium]|nr:MAG: hypothetical protein DRQ25_14100 [Candidatus Fermentibacteria bacterium]